MITNSNPNNDFGDINSSSKVVVSIVVAIIIGIITIIYGTIDYYLLN